MNIPDKIDISNYLYDLPGERIARFPLENRDDSKILVYRKGICETRIFRDLPDILQHGDLLVFNDTKVICARMLFSKDSGSRIEILLLEPFEPAGYTEALNSVNESQWICLVGNAKKWKSENLVRQMAVNGTSLTLSVKKVKRISEKFVCRFSWDNDAIRFSEILALCGLVPIPPYLGREAVEQDKLRYQTVYSVKEGSVAAPTAGLHFTGPVLKKLAGKGIPGINLTLHVGAGTFVPVKHDNAMLHDMHAEHFFVRRESLEKLTGSHERLIAVGTTSVRMLESLYWIGAGKPLQDLCGKDIYLDQWEPYGIRTHATRNQVFTRLLEYIDRQGIDELHVTTKIMIVPGYQFRMTDGMITNFHQPGSTLLLLVAAFTGEDWRKIYQFALENDYRFLSYGDSSLLVS